MPKVDLDSISETNRTGYPPPFDQDVAGRWQRSLADAGGLEDFGARYVRLEPGAWSSQRHWHEGEDELVVMLSGQAVLVEEGRRTLMGPGDIAIFPKNVPDGHHLINEGDVSCTFIAVGKNSDRLCHYPDIDLVAQGATGRYLHKDGTPY